MKKVVYILSTSQTCGVDIEKLEFEDTEQEFLDGLEDGEFEDFDAYVDYYANDRCDEIEQGFGSAIILEDSELDYIVDKIKELREEK